MSVVRCVYSWTCSLGKYGASSASGGMAILLIKSKSTSNDAHINTINARIHFFRFTVCPGSLSFARHLICFGNLCIVLIFNAPERATDLSVPYKKRATVCYTYQFGIIFRKHQFLDGTFLYRK